MGYSTFEIIEQSQSKGFRARCKGHEKNKTEDNVMT